jgi:hemin transport system permease protein
VFLAVRDLRRGWRRFVLVGIVVALVAALSTVLSALADGLVRDGTSGLRALPVSHLAFAPHAEAVFSRSTLDEHALEAWSSVPGVETTPIGVAFVNATPVDGGPSLDLALFGVDGNGFLARSSLAGRATGKLEGLVLASELRADGVQLGARYRIGGSDVRLPVAGFTFGGSYGHVPIAYVSLENWRAITYGANPGQRYSAIAMRVPPGIDVAQVDRRAGTDTETRAGAYKGSPGFTAETATMTLIRGFLLVISALIVGAFFTVLTVQRTRQIGLLKALGASNRYVLRDGIGQMTLVLVAAAVAGTLAGAALVALLDGGSVPVELSPRGVATGGALVVATGVAGSAFAFRRITRVEPAIALGVEA